MRNNRGRIDIIAEMLKLCVSPQKKTRIMYRANLSTTLLNKYLVFILQKELLKKLNNQFETTEKGLKFLNAYTICKTLLNAR